ncbi:transcriptional regulator BkdR [Parvularcula bermudensis HTCC2503]|uniref:Transcriptional regulator BkdR n=1 Tax=Parvularcula bermudensis (strain ATCC BAA-594 / HTCC2503 / KCTC 12087) TaxID=314260 RepID=E0THU3_PARBH|nr:Lrp/AsnC family transcriptional regulator [Parvularcula bermudensis]ADM10236.1 transcriptional regulator BkdR [Parvularcula bermudensis HTCC2503]
MKLDQIDRRILSHLQENARITNAELAEKVGLSPTPCLRRLRRLEKEKVITGYRSDLDLEVLGLPVSVIILVKLDKEDDASLRAFEKSIAERPEVMECVLVTGKYDYFIKVVLPSLSAYEQFLSEGLLRTENIASIESSFTLRQVAKKGPLPSP